ncbi:MAG TPA: PPOX class F420-dependent oxidoreductase [Ktedonobacterales bacterium]|nr:PPOX class F420-dependent oxidoreductase [Ktedonobacterales bacterium]
MSIFTPAELAYLQSEPHGSLATVGPDGQPHVVPVGFRYNPDLDTIDIGGRDFTKRKKYRDVSQNPRVAFLVHDKRDHPRGIEIRGKAEILATGGQDIYPDCAPEMFRIRPRRVVSWGVDEPTGFRSNARSVQESPEHTGEAFPDLRSERELSI